MTEPGLGSPLFSGFLYLDEQLEEASHLLDLTAELLASGVEGPDGGARAGQPVACDEDRPLHCRGGAHQLTLGLRAADKHWGERVGGVRSEMR